jgi:type VI secretion system protein
MNGGPRHAWPALALALAACASKPPPTPLRQLQVLADADANGTSGTQLDLVFVFDTAADKDLPADSASWFANKPALLANLATSVKLVPLQVPAPYSLPAAPLPAGYATAIGVYSYASYVSKDGQPRCKLTPYTSVTLQLKNDHIECIGR